MSTERQLHQILLRPTDVLFFRDGRPMTGSLAGHTAAWPLPDVTSHALHAALHRAGLDGVHGHDHHRADDSVVKDVRKFGSLLTAGPFPVREQDGRSTWFFPRPRDAQLNGSVAVTLCPVRALTGVEKPWQASSLVAPLHYAVANTQPPSKDAGGEPWMSSEAFQAYLNGEGKRFEPQPSGAHFLRDTDIADTENTIGIAIDPETQTTESSRAVAFLPTAHIGIAIDPETQTTGHGEAQGKIYSARYLRLREEFRLGLFAEAMDKVNDDPNHKRDLIATLLHGPPQSIVVGGQQRLCTAERRDAPAPLPLPHGLTVKGKFHQLPNGRFAVKWVLLSPALWPAIAANPSHNIQAHSGGWLPNWIADREGAYEGETVGGGSVLLLDGPGKDKAKRRKLTPGKRIRAHLVAAVVPKPIAVTGWALPNQTGRSEGGAKSTHLAVPAGAVYYFEAESAEAAAALAAALNWHGSDTQPTAIRNRRSTLLGEKGFGLGVCGTWQFFPSSKSQ